MEATTLRPGDLVIVAWNDRASSAPDKLFPAPLFGLNAHIGSKAVRKAMGPCIFICHKWGLAMPCLVLFEGRLYLTFEAALTKV